MGNQLAQPQKLHPEQLAELPNVVLKDILGGGRLLKTVLVVHDVGRLVVKVYHKRGDPIDFQPYERQLTDIRDRLMSIIHSHVWPFQVFSETESAGYLVRPYIFANLYDRLSLRPFLTNIEKQWVAFQLLHALVQCHGQGVCHGDIKCENVLVTSWNWVFLADFASYKPTYLPADNPADFSYYFDIGSRLRCYVAPERFYNGRAPEGGLKPEMDVFSLGCVIAELFLDGKALFDLSQLLGYRKGKYNPKRVLASIDPAVREMVMHMIQLDPGSRFTPEEYLHRFTPTVFPTYFESALHPFFGSILDQDADSRVASTKKEFRALKHQIVQAQAIGRDVSLTDKHDHEAGSDTKGGEDRTNSSASHATSGVGGPSAYVSACESGEHLFAEVGALLSDSENVKARISALDSQLMEGTDEGAEGDGFLVDEGDTVGVSPRKAQTQLQSARPSRVEEVVTEEVYEYQFREAGGEFVEVSSSSGSALPEFWDQRHRGGRKQDIQLPNEGGWQWIGGWEIDQKGTACDEDGWGYKGGQNSKGGWSADCTAGSVWRRRRWVRQRTRRRALSKHGKSENWTTQHMKMIQENHVDDLEDDGECEGMVLLLVLLNTLVRGAKLLESKRSAISLLYESAIRCDDDTCLQRVIPYLVTLVSDDSASIRAVALHYLIKLLSSIHSIPSSDARIFQDYILPSLSLLPIDSEELVRVEYASGLPKLATSACRYIGKGEVEGEVEDVKRKDQELENFRGQVEKVMFELVSGDKSSGCTRMALLGRVDELAEFFGRGHIPNLLMLFTAFLNDSNWRPRAAFFKCVTDVALKCGPDIIEERKSLLEQGLKDSEPSVIANALALVTHLCSHSRFRDAALLELCQNAPALLRHPNSSVRARAVEFIVAVANKLSKADTFARLMPRLSAVLPQDPFVLSSEMLVVEALSSMPPTQPHNLTASSSQASSFSGGSISFRKPLVPSNSNSHSNSNSRAPKTDPLDDDFVLDPAAASYSVKVDGRMTQAGLTAHEAALEGVKQSRLRKQQDNHRDRLASSSSSGDVRSTSALVTSELVNVANKLPPEQLSRRKLGPISAGIHYPGDVGGSSPRIRNAVAEALSTGLNTASSSMSVDPSSVWRPRGVPIAHLAEHRRAVNRLAVARKDRHTPFFVSASNDGTVKVWDLRHLERDVWFHSRLTYGAQEGKILGVTTCEDNKSVASASCKGSIHVWRVEYVEKNRRGGKDEYRGISSRQQVTPDEGPILDVQQWGPLLMYVTQRGGVHAWDVRMKRDAWTLPLKPKYGLLEHFALDPSEVGTWLLTGSSRGYLSLWDVRFQLQVNGWRHPMGGSVDCVAAATAPPEWLGVPGLSGVGPVVYVVAGGNEVGLWDVEEGRCRQVMRVIPREETEIGKVEAPAALRAQQNLRNPLQPSRQNANNDRLTTGLARDLAINELYMPQPRAEGLRTLLPLSYGGLLTAGTDRCVRLWDGQEPKGSYVMCGPPVADKTAAAQGHMQPNYSYQYSRHMLHEVPIIDECCLPTHNPSTPEPFEDLIRRDELSHKDCITDMAMAFTFTRERMLLTCSRDGVVKAWK